MKKSISLKITGKVQGVFYRYKAKEKANELGLFGFICNENDGSVTARIQGEAKKVDEFVKWCKKGTEGSRVQDTDVKEIDEFEDYEMFEIILKQ